MKHFNFSPDLKHISDGRSCQGKIDMFELLGNPDTGRAQLVTTKKMASFVIGHAPQEFSGIHYLPQLFGNH